MTKPILFNTDMVRAILEARKRPSGDDIVCLMDAEDRDYSGLLDE